jgi:AraC-like DNA-binding protein
MADELWQAFVQVAGAVNALLLGAVLVFSPRLHRTRSRKKLGWALLAYAYLLFSFTAVDNFWVPAVWWVWLIDYFVSLFAAALFLDYMSDALGRGPVSRWWYLPPLLIVLFSVIMGPAFIAGPAINFVVLAQFAYSVATTWLYVSLSSKLAVRPHHLFVLLVGLWSLHALQLSLMLAPGVTWLFDAVPLMGAALMLILTVLVLTDSRTLRSLIQVTPSQDSLALSADTVDEYMRAERPYLDSRLTLGNLSTALDIASRDLSQLIGSTGGGNFYQFVNGYRIVEAKRLLADPSERRTSIEAIGLMSGFRSRSTFYEAFRRETEQTPARYREALDTAQPPAK